jgi:CheY-like chemotaxis protein
MRAVEHLGELPRPIGLSSAGHGGPPGGAGGTGGTYDERRCATRIRVLIVDDDVAFLDAARRALTSGGLGFSVETAETGAQALAILAGADRPDLVLLDYHLPDITAPRLLGLSAEKRRPPVLVVTREAHDDAREESLSAGAADFAAKPSRVRALRELVLHFWERHGFVADDSAD